jgi:hypothetical protein
MSKNKKSIVDKINEIIKVADNGGFGGLMGYTIDDNDPSNKNSFGDFDNYSARQTK